MVMTAATIGGEDFALLTTYDSPLQY